MVLVACYNISIYGAGSNGAVVGPRYATGRTVLLHIAVYIFQLQIFHRSVTSDTIEQCGILSTCCVCSDGQSRDAVSLSVESALITVIRTETTAYRSPLLVREVDIGGKGTNQAVGCIDGVGTGVGVVGEAQILCRAALTAALGPAGDGAACQFQSFGGDTDGVGIAAASL